MMSSQRSWIEKCWDTQPAGIEGRASLGIEFSTDLALVPFLPTSLAKAAPCINTSGSAPLYKDVSSSQLLLFQRIAPGRFSDSQENLPSAFLLADTPVFLSPPSPKHFDSVLFLLVLASSGHVIHGRSIMSHPLFTALSLKQLRSGPEMTGKSPDLEIILSQKRESRRNAVLLDFQKTFMLGRPIPPTSSSSLLPSAQLPSSHNPPPVSCQMPLLDSNTSHQIMDTNPDEEFSPNSYLLRACSGPQQASSS
ncbi:hypothetical protein STEG23_010857, partial [Scotinomys teguina]